ncbi:alpha/beta fold hydrolase [Dyella tabacisoli]|uniref:Alpha/beta hydrolase n=1 Tax=Dyella tabacisoli TaxID=2282381 RepID=A0A369UP42_9GAMM|nr:alpha/beta hydrolase [Dyella tabacisoli]RDD81488.1 alpha/beta hydrolase [Dyella tabacisoli]
MRRRQFLAWTGAALATSVIGACASRLDTRHGAAPSRPTDAAAFRAARRYADLPFGKIAYVERGSGDAALFLHGAPLNSFQWRGAIDRLSAYRRCVAPDFMGLGYSEIPAHQSLAADAQVAMLAALLDTLAIGKVDMVASDSGGAVAQLFVARYPERVRTLLLTNCDVEPDSPPPKVKPAIEMARAGTLADATAQWLTDKALARSTFGAAVYRDPSRLADETIDYYVAPLVSSPLRRAQYHAFHLALEPNPLAGIEAALKRSTVPLRIVWGASDDIFSPTDADYLDHIFARSRGIRRVPEAKLFFPEEFPDIIAEEARRLWGVV